MSPAPSPSASDSRPRAPAIAGAVLGLVLATALAYAGVGSHGFVTYDDADYVYANEHVNRGLDAASVRWAFLAFHSGNWHPLTWLSHMLDVELFGLDAGAHHRVAVGLHALNACLCLAVFLGLTRRFWPSVLAAGLFALHPLRVQSVAWASERKDLLAGTFFFLCLLAYLAHARRGGLLRYAALLVALALGLAAKPMLVTLPALLLVLDAWPLERWRGHAWRALLVEKLPLFGLAALASVLTVLAQRSGGAFSLTHSLPLGERLAHAPVALWTYVGRTLWPDGLSFFHPHPAIADPDWSPWGPGAIAAGLALGVATLLAWSVRRRAPQVLVGWIWFVLTALPVIGILQVGEQGWAERYAYLPTVGLYLMVLAAPPREGSHGPSPLLRRVAQGAGLALLLALGVRTRAALAPWRDSETLYAHALHVDPRNHVAHISLAKLLLERGDLERAEEHLEAARAVRPDDTDLLLTTSELLERAGRLEEAVRFYRGILERRPRWARMQLRLGIALGRLGRNDEALAVLEGALAARPEDPELLHNLGLLRLRTGDAEAARACFARAVATAPGFAAARVGHAEALLALGRSREAREELEHAAATDPDAAATRLAWVLATAAEEGLRDGAAALDWARRALSGSPTRRGLALEARAAALAELGRFGEAVESQQEALEALPPAARPDARARLGLYRDGKPFRLPPN